MSALPPATTYPATSYYKGSSYRYKYKDGTSVEFVFDEVRVDAMGLSVYGYVSNSTRSSIAPAPSTIQRIARVGSIDSDRLQQWKSVGGGLYLWIDCGSGTSNQFQTAQSRPSRPTQCHPDSHEPINVGFMHLHLVCRICDHEMGDGSLPRKRLVGRDWQ